MTQELQWEKDERPSFSLPKLSSELPSPFLCPQALNDHLTPLTFLTQTTSPTSADYSLLGLLYPKFTSLSIKDQHSLPSLTRYLSQLTFLFSQATSSSSKSKSDEEQSLDSNIKVLEPTFEGMPKIVRTNPKKEKKSVSNEEGSKKGKEALSGSVASGKKAKASGGGGGATEALTPDPSMIDLRVGKIVKISRHPDADSLYLESVDFGEVEGPRTILSGLVKYVPIEEMENRMVIGVCNLKPVAMRGIKSFGMLLCASAGEADGGKEGGVEPVTPPEGSLIGDKVEVEGWEGKVPLELLNPKKKVSSKNPFPISMKLNQGNPPFWFLDLGFKVLVLC